MVKLFFPAAFESLRNEWKEAWQSKSFRITAISTLAVLILIAIEVGPFFNYIEARPGFLLNDIILNQLPVLNLSVYIFLVIYSIILLTIINFLPNPFLLLRTLQAFGLLTLMRMACLYLIPLSPEIHNIPLEDPFVGFFFYNGTHITKDLFFSGHVSTMFLLFLLMPFRFLKYFFALATLFVAICIIIQHVHYTADILAAPVFAWIIYKVVSRFTPDGEQKP
jgi:membrane-associated phospholipid phosphatase